MTPSDRDRIRSVIAGGLVTVRGVTMTATIADQRATSIARALGPVIDAIVEEALKEAARGVVVVGSIQTDEPCPTCGRAIDDPFHGGFGACPST